MPVKILYTKKFEREYKKLPISLKKEAEKREVIFRTNPFAPTLKTHRLKGKFKDFWSFSITYKHRIIFEFGGKNTAYFHSVGDHRVYQ